MKNKEPTKIFLSHSSQDKKYVHDIAKSLGEKCIYDEINFKPGEKTDTCIYEGLDKTILFVLFISEKSLQSSWVQKEIEYFYQKMQIDPDTRHFLPIIVDNTQYNHPLIPQWMQESYNIQQVQAPKMAKKIIEEKFFRIISTKCLKKNNLENFFVGRNKLIEILESQYYENSPKFVIASGIQGIGRKTLLKNFLNKINIETDGFYLLEISLDEYEGIEDFILKINDLGIELCDIDYEKIVKSSLQEKEEILISIIKMISKHNKTILIEDNGCLVLHTGHFTNWFGKALEHIEQNKMVFVIRSRYRYHYREIVKKGVLALEVSELSKRETRGLLQKLLDKEQIFLEDQEKEDLLKILTGHPEQTIKAVEYLKACGIQYIFDNLSKIVAFNRDCIKKILEQYQNNPKALGLLILLSKNSFFDYVTLNRLIKSNQEYLKLIQSFLAESICNEICGGRYIRLNRSVRDFVARSDWGLTVELNQILQEYIKDFVEIEQEDKKLAGYYLATKERLFAKNFGTYTSKVLPSIALQVIRELYDKKKNISTLIELATIFLDEQDNGEIIEDRIRQYLCLAYIRKQEDGKFHQEVTKINKRDQYFLRAYYFRKREKYQEALNEIQKSLQEDQFFTRARQEQLRIYIALREYDIALDMAKNFYQESMQNAYFFDAYMTCLLKLQHPVKEIENLLDSFKPFYSMSQKSREMYDIMHTRYEALSGKHEALARIEEICHQYSDSHYPIRAGFEIASQYADIEKMKYFYNKLKTYEHISTSSIIKIYEAKILQKEGKKEVAKNIIYALKNYPIDTKEKILQE